MSESRFYRTTYETVQLWVAEFTTDRSRSIVVHNPASGDDAVVQDRGQGTVRASGTLLFDYMRGDTLSPVDRLNQFKALLDGKDHVLTHPVEGSFTAKIGRFTYTVNGSGTITSEVEFIASQAVRDAIPAGAASIPASGEGLLDAVADAYTAEFEDAGIDDLGLGETTKASADDWVSQPTVNTRQVLTQTGQYSQQLASQADGLQNNHDEWQAFKSSIQLAESVRVAAESATSDTATTFLVRLATNQPLRALLASEFGADEVDFRYQQVIDLNDLATPGILEVGQELQLPTKTPRARNG